MKRRLLVLPALCGLLLLLGAGSEQGAPGSSDEGPQRGDRPSREARLALCGRILEQRETLERRAGELDRLERTLKEIQGKIAELLADLERRKKKLKQRASAEEESRQRARPVARLLETMTPKDAAGLAKSMPSSFLAEVLSAMKPKNAAKVLAALSPAKASEVLKKLGRASTKNNNKNNKRKR